MEPGSTPDGPIERRAAIRHMAAAGALAWSAPSVISGRVTGPGGVCTPKCIPQIGSAPTATASSTCTGNGSSREIDVIVDLSGDLTATCPCGGTAVLGSVSVSSTAGNASISGSTVTVDLGRGSPTVFDVTVSRSASCQDRDNTTCAVTCRTTFTVGVNVPNQGNCNRISASITNTSSSCS